jgi:hypothetical protein
MNETPVDVIVCTLDDFLGSRVSLAHLVFANGWSAHTAINRPFSYFHNEVTRNGKALIPTDGRLEDKIINSGRFYERVGAWSIKSQPHLDRNPRHTDRFKHDPTIKELYLRFERQVLYGLPEIKSFVFIIQTHMVDMLTDPDFFIEAIEKAHPDAYIREILDKDAPSMLEILHGSKESSESQESQSPET